MEGEYGCLVASDAVGSNLPDADCRASTAGCFDRAARAGTEEGMGMSILSWPKRPRAEKEIAPDWDPEIEAMRVVGEWLATLTPKQAFRVLTYWFWRYRDGADPRVEKFVTSVADESIETLGTRNGFTERPES